MQDVVDQRHLVGAGRRVRHLNREYIGPAARAAGPVAVSVFVGSPAVVHRLGADRAGRPVQARKREALAPAPSPPTLPPSTPVNVASLVSPGRRQCWR